MLRKLLLASILMLGAPAAMAATCSVDIEGNDQMKFNLANIDVSKACKDFTINLKHTGKLPKAAMGHNVVIAATSDMKGVDTDGIKAGLPNNYVKPDDARVIARPGPHAEAVQRDETGDTAHARLPVGRRPRHDDSAEAARHLAPVPHIRARSAGRAAISAALASAARSA